jgi:hypothetical protein
LLNNVSQFDHTQNKIQYQIFYSDMILFQS